LICCVAAVFNLYIFPPPAFNDATLVSNDTDGILLLGRIYQANIPNRTISISWLVGGCGNLRLQSAPTLAGSQCGQANVSLAVYINNQPQFHYDPTIQPRTGTNETLFIQDLNEFQHTHTIDINNARLRNNRIFEQEYFYPFEGYSLTATFMAVSTANNTPLPILSLALSDIVDDFQPHWNETKTQSFINNTFMDSRTTTIQLERTYGTKVYVMLLVAMNWLLTIAVVYIAAIALFTPDSKIGDGVALLPMTIILTLPHLRQLFPDAPAFGLFLDALGLVLQMSLVSICAISLLCFSIKPKPPQEASNEGVNLKEFDTRTLTDPYDPSYKYNSISSHK